MKNEGVLIPASALLSGRVRGRSVSVKRLSKRDIDKGRWEAAGDLREVAPVDRRRPATRAECLPGGRNAQRPCPYVSCARHLALDVSPKSGAIKHNFPNLEVWEMNETCSLDVADRSGATIEEVGAIMNLTRERIRQIEANGVERARPHAASLLSDEPVLRPEPSVEAPLDVSPELPELASSRAVDLGAEVDAGIEAWCSRVAHHAHSLDLDGATTARPR